MYSLLISFDIYLTYESCIEMINRFHKPIFVEKDRCQIFYSTYLSFPLTWIIVIAINRFLPTLHFPGIKNIEGRK
jgi:hypothetical protein